MSEGTGAGDLPDRKALVHYLRQSSRGPLKPKELARGLDVPNAAYRAFKVRLRELESDGTLYRVKGNRYAVPEKINLVVGRLSVIRSGDGFVVPDDASREDVFVPSTDHGSAMDGDQVVARIESRPRGRNPVGRIIKVLERAHPTLVGTFRTSEGLRYVDPQDKRVLRDVLVPAGEEMDAGDGDVVLVKIVHYGDRKLNPLGAVEKVLGKMTDPGVDVLSVLYGHGLPLEF
ncbi:MAG: hypothetical protein PVI57_21575, partial [Gemmatimonadota bacterium]